MFLMICTGFYKIYGVENFYFVDEAMTAWIGKIIAKRIYESGLSFHWYSEFRFDSFLNYSYLSEIKKGGCSLMFLASNRAVTKS